MKEQWEWILRLVGGLPKECRPEGQLGLSGERVNSSSTDTGLGCCCCCCSPLTTEHFTSETVLNLSSKPMEATAGDGDRGGGSVERTASIIFFSALRSSSHLCNAPSSFCLFCATESCGAGAASNPMSLATSAGPSRRLSAGGGFTLERRISAGNVGLLGTSLDSFRSLVAVFAFSGREFSAAAGAAFLLTCLFPENKDKRKEYCVTKIFQERNETDMVWARGNAKRNTPNVRKR